MMKKKKILGLALLTIMLAMPMMISLVEATEWIEVTRFTGSGTTDYFTCEHIEWRIRWEYVPSSTFLGLAMFGVVTYEAEEDVRSIDYIWQMGYNETNGVSYIHNQEGTFYMGIITANTEGFTVIVEEDVDSIPEFTPATLAIVLITVSILAVVLSKKFKKRR